MINDAKYMKRAVDPAEMPGRTLQDISSAIESIRLKRVALIEVGTWEYVRTILDGLGFTYTVEESEPGVYLIVIRK